MNVSERYTDISVTPPEVSPIKLDTEAGKKKATWQNGKWCVNGRGWSLSLRMDEGRVKSDVSVHPECTAPVKDILRRFECAIPEKYPKNPVRHKLPYTLVARWQEAQIWLYESDLLRIEVRRDREQYLDIDPDVYILDQSVAQYGTPLSMAFRTAGNTFLRRHDGKIPSELECVS